MDQAEVTLSRSGTRGDSLGVDAPSVAFTLSDVEQLTRRIGDALIVVMDADGAVGVSADNGRAQIGLQKVADVPPQFAEWLGDRSFQADYGCRFAYVTGAMANGIASVDLVVAAAEAGLVGFFGAAGLGYERIEAAIGELHSRLSSADGPRTNWGVNLIHAPNEPQLEWRTALLLAQTSVPAIEISAFTQLTKGVAYLSAKGLSQTADGRIVRARRLMAKVSRPELAERFFSPIPDALLQSLCDEGLISASEFELAKHIAAVDDLTVESDSGGHTDNRPLGALFPSIEAARRRVATRFSPAWNVRLGAAGGIGTPGAVASAFSLGASYVVTGSINQCCVESGLSERGRALLMQASVADVMMAPAADMFEQGVEVQVLRRGSMFGARGHKLWEIYRSTPSLDQIPAVERERLEKEVFGQSLADVWADTESFWSKRDPEQVDKAHRDPKHKMALCFRWYLGKASRWAIDGAERSLDYQIWCGPAMGAFNDWSKGSSFDDPNNRRVGAIAHTLLHEAAVHTRKQHLRTFGVPVQFG